MPKKTIGETKIEEKVETPQQDKGREEEYFFPGVRKTVKATSLEEAKKKLNQ